MTETFFDQIGGRPCIERVHTILYDKLLTHPWLKGFFVGKECWHLEVQQTEFMIGLFGGTKVYGGRAPMRAHQHLFITEEVFMLRHDMLAKSLIEAKVPTEHHERWLQIDMSMKSAIIKKTVDECEGRYRTEEIIVVPKPS